MNACAPSVAPEEILRRLVADARQRETDAARPLALGGGRDNLWVVEGALDLFAFRCAGDDQLGSRVPLGRIERGGMMFALAEEPGVGADVALLAVGVPGTRIAENLDLRALPGPCLAAALERTVATLSAALRVDPGRDRPTADDHAASARLRSGTRDPIEDLARLRTVFTGRVRARLDAAHDAARTQLERQRADSAEALAHSLSDLASVVADRRPPPATATASALFDALHSVGAASNIEIVAPDPARGAAGHLTELEAITTASGVRSREVLLRDDWWRHDAGPLLAWLDDETPVALLRDGSGYVAVDGQSRDAGRHRVDPDFAARLGRSARMLYRPLPPVVGGVLDLLRPLAASALPDLRRYLWLGFAAGGLAAVIPLLTGILMEEVIPRAAVSQLAMLVGGLIVAGLGAALFEVVRAATLLRVAGRADLQLQAAVVDRLLRLPVRFFRDFTSGDLAERAMSIHRIRAVLSDSAVSALLGALFSVSSLVLMFLYSPALARVAIALVSLQLVVSLGLTVWQLHHERAEIAFAGRVEGFTAQLLTGIGKLRVADAVARAYGRWAALFAEQRRRFVATRRIANIGAVVFTFYPTLAVVAIDVGAVRSMTGDGAGLSLGAFIAFTAAFGQLQAAAASLARALTDVIGVLPLYERLAPILRCEPEAASGRRTICLRGEIELNHLTHRYETGTEPVLADLSLRIRAGEFVAVVGASGAGKSTLLRLLLGFERPERGVILIDGVPSDELDPGALRRQTGVVLQDGQLASGTLLSNIVGTSTLTQADAEAAAARVGLDVDVEALPMGMHTVVTEGVSTLSGGQRQRVLLARALVRRPAVLLLDEATSALDNRTQEIVTRTLRDLDCTRVVVAHRLSTILHADRIVVLDRGRIAQQGTYASLMAEPGPFRALAERQLI